MKDLYIENYKTLVKEIEEDTNKKDTLCSWTGRTNTIKMSRLSRESMWSRLKFQYIGTSGIEIGQS